MLNIINSKKYYDKDLIFIYSEVSIALTHIF